MLSVDGCIKSVKIYKNLEKLYIYISLYISLSCRAVRTNLSDSLSICLYHPSLQASLLDDIRCPYWVVVDSLLLVVQHVRRGSSKNVVYEFVLTSRAVSGISYPSNLDGFRNGSSVVVNLMHCGMLFPGFVQYDS